MSDLSAYGANPALNKIARAVVKSRDLSEERKVAVVLVIREAKLGDEHAAKDAFEEARRLSDRVEDPCWHVCALIDLCEHVENRHGSA